jgi:hypothetical protein
VLGGDVIRGFVFAMIWGVDRRHLGRLVFVAWGGAEVMASPTAARSYNVLLSDGRRIAAALLPVG